MPILAPIYAIHHDPEIYPDPEKFDPERWAVKGIPIFLPLHLRLRFHCFHFCHMQRIEYSIPISSGFLQFFYSDNSSQIIEMFGKSLKTAGCVNLHWTAQWTLFARLNYHTQCIMWLFVSSSDLWYFLCVNFGRFTDAEKAKRHPYTYLPFGHGPHNCVGMRFALLEIKLTLVRLLKKFKLERTEKTAVSLVVWHWLMLS